MQPSDIGACVAAGTPRVSPDGTTVAFVVTRIDGDANRYRSQIWLVPADGSRPAEPFTSGEHRDGAPTWSPDGRRLAFTSTGAGDGKTALRIAPVATGGETVTLARFDEGVDDLVWSPDGRHLAFTSRGPRRPLRDRRPEAAAAPAHHPLLLPARRRRLDRTTGPSTCTSSRPTGRPAPLDVTPGEHQFWSPAWSPDGTIAGVRRRRPRHVGPRHVTDLFTWSFGDAGAGRASPSSTGAYDHPSWSPDGSRIALLGYDEPDQGRRRTPASASSTSAAGGPVDRHVARPHLRSPTARHERTGLGRRRRAGARSRTGATSTSTGSAADDAGRPELVVGRRALRARLRPAPAARWPSPPPRADRPAEIFTSAAARSGRSPSSPTRFVAAARPRAGRAVHGPVDRAAPRSTSGSTCRPTSTRRSATPPCSTSTAARSRSTATGSSTRPRSRRPPATSWSWPTHAARRAGRRRGRAPSSARRTAYDAGTELGQRRLRRRDGGDGRGPAALPVHRPGPARRPRRFLRRLHDDVGGARTRTGSRPPARSGRSTT